MRQKRKIHERISTLTSLPSFPVVAHRLLSLCSDLSTCAASDVALLLSGDPSLTVRVLRLANSAYYAPAFPITTLTQAVVIVGTRVISTMVLAMSVFDLFPSAKNTQVFDRDAFWRHCLACGVIGKLLLLENSKKPSIDPETAFCAGLLHDIGTIVLEQYMHEDYMQTCTYAKEHGYALYEAEQKVLGFTHCDVAAWLTETWDLPQSLCAPATWHHDPLRDTIFPEITRICHYADWVHRESIHKINPDTVLPHVDPTCISSLGVSEEALERVRAAWPGMVNELANAYLT